MIQGLGGETTAEQATQTFKKIDWRWSDRVHFNMAWGLWLVTNNPMFIGLVAGVCSAHKGISTLKKEIKKNLGEIQ